MERDLPQATISYDATEHRTVTEAVAFAVAEVEGTSPLDVPPLAETIDPDALEGLFRGPGSDVEVTFSYCGYDVTVTTDDTVLVAPRATQAALA